MIELQTGNFIFPELSISLSPLHCINDFVSIFPKDSIENIRDMNNGYIWYDVREKIYEIDYKIPVWMCFNPEGQLEFINLYPQVLDTKVHREWADWTENETKKDKEYCETWLSKYCGLTQEKNEFTWGTITAFFDPCSASCGIGIRYTK